MVTGASGLLGYELCNQLSASGRKVSALKFTNQLGIKGVEEFVVDITNKYLVKKIVEQQKPDIIVHAAGITNVDECEKNPSLAETVHVMGTRNVAESAKSKNISLIYISTDHLWDGTNAKVDEKTPPYPINTYAKTKLKGELAAFEIYEHTLSIRTNFFGEGRPWRTSFSDWILKNLSKGSTLNMFTDAYFTPISTQFLCQFIIELAHKKANGIFNVAGSERLSKYDFAVLLAKKSGYSSNTIKKILVSDFGFSAPRPRDMSLSTKKIETFLGRTMPTAAESISTLSLTTQKNNQASNS